MPHLVVEEASKEFGSTPALQSVNARFEAGTITAITGESGCGKTTLLRCIAGLETLSSGKVFLQGKDITTLPPEKRNIGFVFQNLALFPHLNIEQNVGFALKESKGVTRKKVDSLLEKVHLTGLNRRFPHELSGGQQQRVALARAIAKEPVLMLMDEPFSNLDEMVKGKIRHELLSLIRELDLTTLIVTHSATDAFLISQRVIMMKAGAIIQEGIPSALYDRPNSQYVSDFFGPSVIMDGSVANGLLTTAFGAKKIAASENGHVKLFARPECVKLGKNGEFSGKLIQKTFNGPHEILIIESPDGKSTISVETERCQLKPGELLDFQINESDIRLFAAD